MDFSKYPFIGKVLGWSLPTDGRRELEKSFTLIFERDRLSVWSRRL
jgi:hypothetical protein